MMFLIRRTFIIPVIFCPAYSSRWQSTKSSWKKANRDLRICRCRSWIRHWLPTTRSLWSLKSRGRRKNRIRKAFLNGCLRQKPNWKRCNNNRFYCRARGYCSNNHQHRCYRDQYPAKRDRQKIQTSKKQPPKPRVGCFFNK